VGEGRKRTDRTLNGPAGMRSEEELEIRWRGKIGGGGETRKLKRSNGAPGGRGEEKTVRHT